jgi:DNA-binding XRE family transcriptional regulator
MNIDIKKVKQAEKEGRLLDWNKLFASYPKEEQEEIKRRSKLIMVRMEVRRLRMQKKLTQSQLAQKVKVKREYISRIESGEQNVTIETLIKIASAVGKEFKFKFE